MKYGLFAILFLLSVSALGQYRNIEISKLGRPNETCMAMHPKNPKILVAGANLNNVYVSKDGGLTWKMNTLRSSFGVWGDPVVIADTTGNFYYFHLSNPPGAAWIDRIVCQKSNDEGFTWYDGTYMGLNGTKAQDKHWVALDAATNTFYVTWTQFDKYGDTLPGCESNIMFSKSTDGGESWSPALRINEVSGDCKDSSLTTEGAVPAVGPNGEVYAAWAGPVGIVFDMSLDGGQTWLDREILVDSLKTGWTYDISGLSRCNGFPVTICDLSTGPHRGTIYINWSDQRNGTDNTDIWVCYSKDGGYSWSKPTRINTDTGRSQQFLTWMTIDPDNGYLYAIYYDRRHYSDNRTDVYMAWSVDGAKTWKDTRISESPFIPESTVFFGDYSHIIAKGGMVRPIWTRMDNGQTSVWTAMVDPHRPGAIEENYGDPNDTVIYPNPTGKTVHISFKNIQAGKVSVILTDESGRKLKSLIENRYYESGKHTEVFDISALNLPQGIYFWRILTSEGEQRKRWIILP